MANAFKSIRRAELIKGGFTIKQGEIFTLGFQLYDSDGVLITPTVDQTISVKIANLTGVIYETNAIVVENHIEFTVDENLGYGQMNVELKVTEGTTLIQKYPADDFIKLKITKSLDDANVGNIYAVTAEQMFADIEANGEVAAQAFAAAENAETIAGQAVETADAVRSEFDQVIAEAGSNNPEVVNARMGEVNLKAYNEKVNQQLAETDNKLNVEDWELSSRHRKKQAIVVFISDDATTHDYTRLKPIFESEGVPLCLGVITDAVAAGYAVSDFLTNAQLRELEDMGWEIMSHSVSHTNPFITGMGDAEAESNYRDSKADLIARGFNVQSYATPGGLYNTRERMYAKKHYRAARVSDYGVDGLNHSPIESHELKTIWLDETYGFTDFAYFKEHIDKAIAKNALLIISTHALQISLPATVDVFHQVIQYAKTNTQVMTLRDALNETGNLIEIGDFTKSGTGTKAPFGKHTVVGSDGTLSDGKFTIAELNTFTPATPFSAFPYGETIVTVDTATATATSAPENTAGTLKMYKPIKVGQSFGYNYQEYYVLGTGRTYLRGVLSDTTFQPWKLVSTVQLHNLNTYTPATGLSSLPMGITFSPVNGATAVSTNAPENAAGTLVTYKVSNEGDINYNYQMYHLYGNPNVYKRKFLTNTTFSPWEIVFATQPLHNAYDCTTLPSGFLKGVVTEFTTNNLTGTPTGAAGTVIMHNFFTTTGSRYNFQEFHVFGTPSVYKRYVIDANTYSAWVKISGTEAATTANRPVNPTVIYVGYTYFDITLGKPIWCKTVGAQEVDTLTVTAGATTTGNITVTLNGANTLIGVTAGDTVGSVADKIRAATFSGWVASGTAGSATVVFTRNNPSLNSAPIFATGTTGATATFVVTTAGTNNVWVDATGTAV